MGRLLIILMMTASLAACSQEIKQEAQEPAQVVAPEAQNKAASIASSTASATSKTAAPATESALAKAKPEEEAETSTAEAKSEEEAGTSSAKADNRTVFEANYRICYSSVTPGAPVIGKNDDWTPRIKQGKETLHKHALGGFKAMPAKDGNANLSNDGVKVAVDYVANRSGTEF